MPDSTLIVHLRLGIAPPVSVDLDRAALPDLKTLSVETLIASALARVDRATTNGFVPEMRETLRDAQTVIELTHGGSLSVVSRKSTVPALDRPEITEIEIGVSKPNQGG